MAKKPRTVRLNDNIESNINTLILKNKDFSFNEYVNKLIEADLNKGVVVVSKLPAVSKDINPIDFEKILSQKVFTLEAKFDGFIDEILNYRDLQKATFDMVSGIQASINEGLKNLNENDANTVSTLIKTYGALSKKLDLLTPEPFKNKT